MQEKNLPIYLDYMATTPLDQRVLSAMLPYLGQEVGFGNPASTHLFGKMALQAVEKAREQIADSLHTEADAIVFTSGATEANNLAIFGSAYFYQAKGKHLITMSTEHKSVLECFQRLESEGFSVTYLSPMRDGLLDLTALEKALRKETILVSIMHANNEIGVIQDISSIANLLADKGIIFHVDAAQSAGKVEINLTKMPISLLSLSAHKNYGPKGIGALFVRSRPRVRLQARVFGGGHERGLRAGTLPTHQIVGMGEAFAIAHHSMSEQDRIRHFRDKLWQGIQGLPGVHLNGHHVQRLAGNLNVSFGGLEASALLTALNDLAVSTMSACESARMHSSYVLKALGLSDEEAYSAIRFCVGRFTTACEIERAIEIITTQIKQLHTLGPK